MIVALQSSNLNLRHCEVCSTTVAANNGCCSLRSKQCVAVSGRLRLLALSHKLVCCSFNGPASIYRDEAEVEVCRAAVFALMISCAGRVSQTARVAGPHKQAMSAPTSWSMARRGGRVLLGCDQASAIKLADCDSVHAQGAIACTRGFLNSFSTAQLNEVCQVLHSRSR